MRQRAEQYSTTATPTMGTSPTQCVAARALWARRRRGAPAQRGQRANVSRRGEKQSGWLRAAALIPPLVKVHNGRGMTLIRSWQVKS